MKMVRGNKLETKAKHTPQEAMEADGGRRSMGGVRKHSRNNRSVMRQGLKSEGTCNPRNGG